MGRSYYPAGALVAGGQPSLIPSIREVREVHQVVMDRTDIGGQYLNY
jgi:hypothetical protein